MSELAQRRRISGPLLAGLLLVLTAIPIVISLVRIGQIPLDALPADAAKFTAVPLGHFFHAAGGAIFGLLGPFQFSRVMRGRFGRLHRWMGRVFVLAGLALGLTSLRLLWQFPEAGTWILAAARLAAGAALIAALGLGLRAAIRRDLVRHRAWMIRAYAIGMGAATIALIMFPIFVITGAPLEGYLSDLAFVGSWVINIALGEWVIRRR
jgi:hypothetical protein